MRNSIFSKKIKKVPKLPKLVLKMRRIMELFVITRITLIYRYNTEIRLVIL